MTGSMGIEKRSGTCKTCSGPAYRVPNRMNTPDRWVHRRTADWINNPHEVDPQPDDETTDTEEDTP